jgi:hypothetical protein
MRAAESVGDRTSRCGPSLYNRCMSSRPDPLGFLNAELDALKAQGLYRTLRVLEGEALSHAVYDHTSVVNLSSNNYLGFTTHPRLRQAALDAVREFGVGSGAVRTISGTMAMHVELERRLAAFKNVEAVVVFQSGFAANAGTVSAILNKDDVIISDSLNHASIIDGCRLSKAPIKVFPHKDAAAARAILQELPAAQRKLLITDGVFSMDGDLGPLPALCDLADEFGCIMMVDDAHASGVFGRQGRGTVDHFGCHGRVDIQVGTLSNARPHRLPAPSRPAVPLLHLASAGCDGRLHRRARRARERTAVDGTALGQHALLQGGAHRARLQHRHEREPDHARHRGRGVARRHDVRQALREGRLRAEHRLPHGGPRPGAAAHHRLGHAHARGPAVRARPHGRGGPGTRRHLGP